MSIPTPSRRSMVEITNDIVGVREALYDATGSALLAREKCKAEDARIIYEALCRANNVLWTVVEELQAFPSETHPLVDGDLDTQRAIATGRYECVVNSPAQPSAIEPNYKALYHTLILAVGCKWPNETRHQTALRYILEAEQGGLHAGVAYEYQRSTKANEPFAL